MTQCDVFRVGPMMMSIVKLRKLARRRRFKFRSKVYADAFKSANFPGSASLNVLFTRQLSILHVQTPGQLLVKK